MQNFAGSRPPYDPNRQMYPNMPMEKVYDAFSPGVHSALAEQMTSGYGGDQSDWLNRTFRDTVTTSLVEPLVETMSKWGVQPDGQPGGTEIIPGRTFNDNNYQQYGFSTGSPYMDQIFGVVRDIPTKDVAAAAFAGNMSPVEAVTSSTPAPTPEPVQEIRQGEAPYPAPPDLQQRNQIAADLAAKPGASVTESGVVIAPTPSSGGYRGYDPNTGWSSYTNPQGVTTTFGRDGNPMGGPGLSPDVGGSPGGGQK